MEKQCIYIALPRKIMTIDQGDCYRRPRPDESSGARFVWTRKGNGWPELAHSERGLRKRGGKGVGGRRETAQHSRRWADVTTSLRLTPTLFNRPVWITSLLVLIVFVSSYCVFYSVFSNKYI